MASTNTSYSSLENLDCVLLAMPGMIALILSYLSIFNLVQAGVLPQGNEAFIKIKRQDEAVGSSDGTMAHSGEKLLLILSQYRRRI